MADEKYQMLDLPMNEVFDWSEDKTPLLDALWNHYMNTSNKDTLSTLKHMNAFKTMSGDEIKVEAEKVLH